MTSGLSRAAAKERTRDALLDIGFALAETTGLDSLSVNAITGAAGVAKGTFFHHFGDRTAYLVQLHRRFHDRILADVQRAVAGLPSGLERLTVISTTYLDACLNQRGVRALILEARALELLAELKIADLAQRPAGTLAYGQQRRLEIARALALGPKFMLLDEPAAGMNEAETEDLLGILGWLVEDRGLGLLIVDHDMHLIMRLCRRIAVLNKGQLIALGSPQEVQRDTAVREAYLGRRHAERMIA